MNYADFKKKVIGLPVIPSADFLLFEDALVHHLDSRDGSTYFFNSFLNSLVIAGRTSKMSPTMP